MDSKQTRINFQKFRKKGIMQRRNKYSEGYFCTICKKEFKTRVHFLNTHSDLIR